MSGLSKVIEGAKEAEAAPIFELGHENNPTGGKFDITGNGKFSRKRENKRVLVLHWGSHSAERLASYFRTTDRSVSAHWAVDETGAYQMLDHDLRAYHAGWINRFSIGIDIASQPVVSNYQNYKSQGRDIQVVDNPTYAAGGARRGDRRVLTLDHRTAENFKSLVFWICEREGIELQVPRDKDGKVRHDVVFRDAAALGDWSGVIGHHHCDGRKWDIAPWWGQIFDGTLLGD